MIIPWAVYLLHFFEMKLMLIPMLIKPKALNLSQFMHVTKLG